MVMINHNAVIKIGTPIGTPVATNGIIMLPHDSAVPVAIHEAAVGTVSGGEVGGEAEAQVLQTIAVT